MIALDDTRLMGTETLIARQLRASLRVGHLTKSTIPLAKYILRLAALAFRIGGLLSRSMVSASAI